MRNTTESLQITILTKEELNERTARQETSHVSPTTCVTKEELANDRDNIEIGATTKSKLRGLFKADPKHPNFFTVFFFSKDSAFFDTKQ